MSIRGKIMAAAAVMTLAGGISAAGTLTARAATPSCYENCTELFTQKFSDLFILDALLQRGKAGQAIVLYRASNADAAEDFTVFESARVSRFASTGLVSSAVAARFGGGCSRVSSVTHKCVSNYANDWAYKFEYAPNGVTSGLCIGVAKAPADGTKVVLESCSAPTATTWVADANAAIGSTAVPLVNGSDTSVSDPYVLNFPGSGTPFQMPTPQLTTWKLQRYSNGGVYNNQLWSADFGPVGGGY
jgi:hypothetical protein